jgi:hypothetical protein
MIASALDWVWRWVRILLWLWQDLWMAWSQWASGHTLHEQTMWGLKMFWWERIGLFLEFLGGATIIVDIVGPQRLRACAQVVRRFRLLTRWFGGHEDMAGKTGNLVGLLLVAGCIGYLLFLAWLLQLARAHLALVSVPFFSSLVGVLNFILRIDLLFLFVVVALQILRLGALILEKCIFDPLAHFLESERAPSVARVFAFIAIVLGAHFHLLAT